jgi:predicted lipoprotein with Yx(FWY)xxD motif
MRATRRWGLLLALVCALAACGGGDDSGGTTAESEPAAAESEAAAEPAEEGVTVATADSDFGPILVDGEGMVLYRFLSDTEGESTCNGECLANWPALVGEAQAGEGVDDSLLGTVERDDGSLQVTYADWPLYHFAADEAPGDTNGQGVGDVWYVVGPDGEVIEEAGAAAAEPASDGATVAVAESDLGPILTDGEGRVLYRFMNDTEGTSACEGECLDNWPALTGEAQAGEGADESLLGTIERPDGTAQVTYGEWPLYYFAGDAGPGETNGQGVGDVWYVVGPDGAAITSSP